MTRKVSHYPGFGRRLGGGVTVGQIGRAAAKAVAAGIKGYRAYSKLMTGSRSTQVATTYQHDNRLVYRKKRMPRRRRRRWVRALRRNVALQMPQQPTFNMVFNDTDITEMNGAFTGQGILTPLLYSYNGDGSAGIGIGVRDMRRIAQNMGVYGDLSTQYRKFVCGSGVFDLTGTYVNSNGMVTLELDLYVIDVGKLTTSIFRRPFDEIDDIQTDLDGAGTFYTRGVTPFQMAVGAQGHGWRILRKQRWQLSSGQSITYQYRDPKNRYFGTAELENNDVNTNNLIHGSQSYRSRGTKMFFFVCKLIGNPQTEDLANFTIGFTRTYSVKLMPATAVQTACHTLSS